MMTIGIVFLVLGVVLVAFKGYVVWNITHDVFNGGGAPTLDFPIVCPIPLSFGVSLVLSALGKHPFPGFGFVAYVGLAFLFSFILWLFYRLGASEREQQLRRIQQKTPADIAPQHKP